MNGEWFHLLLFPLIILEVTTAISTSKNISKDALFGKISITLNLSIAQHKNVYIYGQEAIEISSTNKQLSTCQTGPFFQ